jgi:zeaxanthin glucosyltransferase
VGLRLALLCPPLRGHLDPTLVLARELAARGHDAVLLLPQGVELAVEAPVRVHHLRGPGRPPHGEMLRRLARPALPFGIMRIVRDMRLSLEAACDELPALLDRLGCDALLCDELEPAGGLVARRIGMPFVSIATALPLSAEPGVPPAYVPWDFDPSESGLRRTAGARRIGDGLMWPLHSAIRSRARAWGLGPITTVEDCLSPLLRVTQGVEELDFPARPRGLVYAGPFRPERSAPAADLTIPDGPGPLVFCSLGTLQGARFRLFRAVAEACAVLGLRLVIAHGGRLTGTQIRSLPGRVTAHAFVDQTAVLDRCFLAVCHAGFNTVLDALSAGVPVAALPIGFEQPGTAARIRHAGVGEIVSPMHLGKLRETMRRVLDEPGYRARAAGLASAIAATGGAAAAADAIEAALSAATEASTTAPMAVRDARDDSRSGSR